MDTSKSLFLGGMLPLITIDITGNIYNSTFLFHLLASALIIGFAVSIKKKALEKLASIYT